MDVGSGLWLLPGPARFANSVRTSLQRGFSVQCIIPEELLNDPAWSDGLEQAMDLAIDPVDDEVDRAVPAVVCDVLGLPPILDLDAGAEMARKEEVAGRVFKLHMSGDDDRARDWARFVTEFVAGGKSVNVDDRPRFLILSAHPRAELFKDKSLLLDQHWWWGVLGRIDTTIVASSAAGIDADPVLVESVVEVAGHDLSIAAELADGWDGSMQSLLALLPPLVDRCEDTVDLVHYGGGRTIAPPRALRDAWHDGAVDAWDRYPSFRSPRALSSAQRKTVLETRLWRAQLRELMPFIDEERQRLEEWVRGIPKEIEPDYPVEIGKLSWIVKYDRLVRKAASQGRRDTAEWLRVARNRLAHRSTLSPDEVAKGRRLLDADRRSTH